MIEKLLKSVVKHALAFVVVTVFSMGVAYLVPSYYDVMFTINALVLPLYVAVRLIVEVLRAVNEWRTSYDVEELD